MRVDELPRTVEEARHLGVRFVWTGEPCVNGHIDIRRVTKINYAYCVACQGDAWARWYVKKQRGLAGIEAPERARAEAPRRRARAETPRQRVREAETLIAIHEHGGDGLRGLARRLGIAQSTFSSRVQKLRAAGYIEANSLALTDQGRAGLG